MLFSKSKTKLLSVPEDKEGTALLPDALETVPVGVFSHSTQLTSLSIGDSCATYTSECGVLYTKDKKTLIAAPAGISASVVIPDTTKTIGPFAFAGTMLDAVVVLGAVTTVDTTAFNDKTKQEATVALSATESFDTARSVWEQVGFTKFKMPARPGDSTKPDAGMTQQTGLTYTLLPDYTLSVIWVGTATPDKDLTIPASAMLNGVAYRVSTIEAHAFEGMPIESLTVPSSVTTIGDFAFVGCTSLTTINLSEGVTSLGDSAFERTSLERVVLPHSMTSIGSRAFADIETLSRIVALTDINFVADDVILGCRGVSILTPENNQATYPWNPGLLSSENHIEAYGITSDQANLDLAKGESAGLFDPTAIKLPKDCTISYSYPASKIAVDFSGVVSAKQVGETDVVASIVLDDLVLAQGTRTVTVSDASTPKVPQTPTLPGVAPLSRISLSLSDGGISLLAVNDTFVTTDGYYKCTILEDGTTDATRRVSIAAANRSISIENPVLPSSVDFASKAYRVTSIMTRGFDSCKSLTGSVTIPESIKLINSGPFVYCSNLTSINVVSSNTAYTSQDGVLYTKDMTQLVQCPSGRTGTFAIPESVTNLGAFSFMGCGKTTLSSIPDSVTAIGQGVFEACYVLAGERGTISISRYVETMGNGVFAYCGDITAINVAADNPFYLSQDGVVFSKDMKTLREYPGGRTGHFTIPDSVTLIDDALRGRNEITSIIVPSSVKSGVSFTRCNSLNTVVLLDGQTSLPKAGFTGCRSLGDVFLGYSIASFWGDSFSDFNPANTQVHLAPGLSDAVWKNAGFKVSQSPFVVFDPTGGSPMPQPQDVVSGQPTTKPETDPTKEGYVFTGWYTAPTGGTAWSFSTPVTEDITTLYAQWATARTVTFDGNGGEPATSTKVVADGTALGASGKPTDPARTGYTFSGWFDAATGGSAYNFNSSVTSDFTLYAHWKPNTYTVTYSANGASGTAPADTPATYDTDFVLPDQGTLAKTGHTFVGWNTEPNGSGTTYVAGSTQKNLTSTLGGTVTLYAKWTPIIYTVTYNSTGGSTVLDTPAAYDTYLSAPESPTRQGYAFAGWYREKDLVIPWDFEVNKVTCDMTLFAKWTAIVDVDAPIDPKIEIDAQGNVITSAASTRSFVSRSPQTVAITGVSCTTTASTSLVFPNSAQWPGIKISIIEPSKPYDGAEVKLGKTTTAEFMIPKAPENSTSELSLAFGLILPSPVSISYIDQPNGVDIATLSYTFALLGGE